MNKERSLAYTLTVDGLGRLGEMLLLGAVIGWLLDAEDYSNYFYEKAQRVVLGKEFLEKRTDRVEVWKNVSSSMLSERFRDIHEQFADKLQEYLVEDRKYFLKDMETTICIEFLDQKTGLVKIVDVTEYDIVTDFPGEPIHFHYERYPAAPGVAGAATGAIDMDLMFIVDKKPVVPVMEQKTDKIERLKIVLSGKRIYHMKATKTVTQNIRLDPMKSFAALSIIQKMTVRVNYADGIRVIWQDLGTPQEFEPIETPNNNELRRKHDGIILKNQGYAVIIQQLH